MAYMVKFVLANLCYIAIIASSLKNHKNNNNAQMTGQINFPP